jgi:hypothetical protein
VLVVAGSVAAVPNAAGAQTPLAGIDQPALVAICERFQGRLLDKLPPPHRYGCELSDGRIGCLETTECSFHRLDDQPPFEESCDRGRGKYRQLDVATFGCWTEVEVILLICDGPWVQDCGVASEPHEQPMPKPSH